MTKNRGVSLYIYSKVGRQWKYRPAPARPKNLPEGSSFVIMWYEGENASGNARKRLLNVGKSADVAKVAQPQWRVENPNDSMSLFGAAALCAGDMEEIALDSPRSRL